MASADFCRITPDIAARCAVVVLPTFRTPLNVKII